MNKIIQAVWAATFCSGSEWDKENFTLGRYNWVKLKYPVNNLSFYEKGEVKQMMFLAKLDSRP